MCTCDQLLHKLSNLIGLLSWSFMLPPPNRFPSVLQPLPLALVVKLVLNNTFLRTHAPFRSFTFLLSLGTELTENQCQSVCGGRPVSPTLGRRSRGRAHCTNFPRVETQSQHREPTQSNSKPTPTQIARVSPASPTDWASRPSQGRIGDARENCATSKSRLDLPRATGSSNTNRL